MPNSLAASSTGNGFAPPMPGATLLSIAPPSPVALPDARPWLPESPAGTDQNGRRNKRGGHQYDERPS